MCKKQVLVKLGASSRGQTLKTINLPLLKSFILEVEL